MLRDSFEKVEQLNATKRMYTITLEGKDVLAVHIVFMNTQAHKLRKFTNMPHPVKKKQTPNSVRYGYFWLFLDFFIRVFNVSLDFVTKPYEIEIFNNILSDEIK